LWLQLSRVVHREGADHGTSLLRDQLPGYQVGVVLHLGNEDLIAGLEETPAIAGSNQIERSGSARGEDDLRGMTGIDESPHLFAGLVIGCRRLLAQGMNTPVHVGGVGQLEGADRVNDLTRTLAGSRVVEIDQRIPADSRSQPRKVAPCPLGIERSGAGNAADAGSGGHASVPSSSRALTRDSKPERTAG